jgi:hypothetical protein
VVGGPYINIDHDTLALSISITSASVVAYNI